MKPACTDCGSQTRKLIGKRVLRCATCIRTRERLRKRKAADNRRKATYGGLTPAEYDRLVEHQNGRCALCQYNRPKCVDHDHITGLVRGLACDPCNRWVLGRQARDDINFFRRGIEYLTNPPASQLGIVRYGVTKHET